MLKAVLFASAILTVSSHGQGRKGKLPPPAHHMRYGNLTNWGPAGFIPGVTVAAAAQEQQVGIVVSDAPVTELQGAEPQAVESQAVESQADGSQADDQQATESELPLEPDPSTEPLTSFEPPLNSTSGPSRRLTGYTDDCMQSLVGQSWESIRVHVEYVDVDTDIADSNTRTKLREIVNNAIAYWSETLQVRRVQGKLQFPRACAAFGGTNSSCISPGTTEYSCGNIAGQDLLLPLTFFRKQDIFTCSAGVCTWSYTIPAGSAGSNMDLIVLVTAKQDGICGTGGSGVLAFASNCLADQCNRPVVAQVNMCPHSLDVSTIAEQNNVQQVLIHEMTHALVFSSDLFGRFRYADGTPRVARNLDGLPSQTTYKVTDNGIVFAISNVGSLLDYNMLYEDVSGVVGNFDERGMSTTTSCSCPIGNEPSGTVTASDLQSCLTSPRGGCVSKIITEKVVEKVKEFFDCPTLTGMELENQNDENSWSIFESHWETRVFSYEFMTPVVGSEFGFISTVSLALFEDSGWYLPDYSKATRMIPGAFFGYKSGCAFAKNKCLGPSGALVGHGFCNEPSTYTCSLDHTQSAYCDASTGGSGVSSQSWFQYFNNLHGAALRGDYCPVVRSYSNGLCTDSSTMSSSSLEGGEWKGESSRCFENTLSSTGTSWPVYGSCYKTFCSTDGSSYTVLLNDGTREGIELPSCTSAGQVLSAPSGWVGTLTCADPAIICADFSFGYLSRASAGVMTTGEVTGFDSSTSGAQGTFGSLMVLLGLYIMMN